MSADLAHIRQIMAEADCLYAEAEVEAAIDAVASTIMPSWLTETQWCSA